MVNNSKQYNSKAFNGLADVSPFSLVDDKFSFENETQFHLLGILIFFWGITLIFWCPFTISLFLRIIIILALMILGFLFVKYIGSFSVLNISNNTLYREYRFGNFIFFKWKLIELSEIVEFGITHKIGRVMSYGSDLNNFIIRIAFILVKREEYLSSKPFNPKFGGVEKTALIYLTKKGKIGRINKFSSAYDSDTVNRILAGSLSSYADIPVKEANSFEGLTAKKIANKYRLVSYKLSTLFFSEDFMRFIIPLFLLLSAIAFFATLLHFNLI